MTVFTSRINKAYLKKRSKKQMLSASLVLGAIASAFVFAATQAERDSKLISEMSWPLQCCHVVGGNALNSRSSSFIFESHVGQLSARN